MEKIRRVLRGVLGWDSWPYRRGSELLNLMMLLRNEELGTALSLQRLGNAAPGGDAEALRFARLIYPFYLRPGTKDVSVAINNFVREEYGMVGDLTDPRVLVDCGAYVGDTSAYFLSRFPGLRSIALEPMADSLTQARTNLSPYGDRVELRQIALTSDGTMVRMSGIQTGASIGDKGDIEVVSETISQILDGLPEGRIDILKMDIEGAEEQIFAQSPELWLDRVDLIIVETHGRKSTDTVLNALAGCGWKVNRSRNLYFCRKT